MRRRKFNGLGFRVVLAPADGQEEKQP